MVFEKSAFVSPDDPVLIRTARAIAFKDIRTSSTKHVISRMLGVAYGNRKDRTRPTVVGLAAPQIGISRRVIAVDVGAGGHGELSDLRVYLNPEIIWKSNKMEEWCEGCWSTGRVCGVVSRYSEIKIKAYTTEGELVEETHRGYVARIFQHEIDHLQGIEFVQHITDDAKLHWVEEGDWQAYKIEEGWRDWERKCPRKKWEKIKGIA